MIFKAAIVLAIGFVATQAISMGRGLHPELNAEDGAFNTQNWKKLRENGINLTRIRRNVEANESGENIVEVLIVCDKEFGDLFDHNKRRILDYFEVYFWDINMRFRTLPSVKISFQIADVVVIRSTSDQPFIEDARDPDGKADLGNILGRFASWTYEKMDSLPTFDIAMAFTNTRLNWTGGLAYHSTACRVDHAPTNKNYGTLVIGDNGGWGSVGVAAHEIAHSLGAPHDDDGEYPGGCDQRGYIMSGSRDHIRWFFSSCSDRTISEYVRSEQATCIRTPTSKEYTNRNSEILAPSMQEQCRRRLNDPEASIMEEDTGNCLRMRCRQWKPEGYWLIYGLEPVDNSPCKNGGRCFRGRCRQQGKLLQNVESGKCAVAPNPNEFMVVLKMITCPTETTPLDKWTVTEEEIGKVLGTPWNSKDGMENGDRCIYTGMNEGDALATDKCSQTAENPWHGWDFVNAGDEQILLRHRRTKRCAKPNGDYLASYENCDVNDLNMRWKLI